MDRPHSLLLPARPTKLLPTRAGGKTKLDHFAADAPLPDVPGYEIVGLLGQGGMGVVYKARDLVLKRFVALKMIAADHVRSAMRQRFQTEAETFARLQHPNFVQIYEVGQHDGRPYLALELVEGGTLSHRLAEGPFPARDAAQLVAVLAHAMHHAHQRGVIHRDLKPSNVLITAAGGGWSVAGEAENLGSNDLTRHPPTHHPKISDFGLAKLLDLDDGQTCSGIIMGTPAYMAPEQAAGRAKAIGPATDVYALGVILYECLTGRPPFFGENGWDVMVQVIHDDPRPPSHWQPRLARDLDTICLKALTKDPARRYASAEALAEDLDHFAAGEAIAARPDAWLRKVARRLRKRPVTLSAALLVFGTIFLGGSFWLGRVSDAKDDLARGSELLKKQLYSAAEERFSDGLEELRHVAGANALEMELRRELRAIQLRVIADQIRLRYDPDELDDQGREALARICRKMWDSKDLLLGCGSGDPEWENRVRNDYLDIALIDLELDSHTAADRAAGNLDRLDELEQMFGTSPALVQERRIQLRRLGRTADADQLTIETPKTVAEWRQLGRALCEEQKFDEAAAVFARGLELEPSAIFLHFDQAKCAMHRKRFDDAIAALTACIALEPNGGVCYSRRAMAYWERAKARPADAAEDRSAAFADIRLALQHDPDLPEAWYNRGFFRSQQGDYAAAAADIRTALEKDYPRAKGNFNLAIIQWKAHDFEAAKASLRAALEAKPNHAEAKALLNQWEH